VFQRRWTLALGLAASTPIVVAAVDAIVVGWQPTGDRAYIATNAFDVLTGRTPLLGPLSAGATAAAGQETHSPGPLLYWLLAVPARFLGAPWLQVTAGVVNVACVLGLVGLAERRGGRALQVATAIAIPLVIASLPAETHSDIWNPSASLLPFTLLVFVCWSLACGEYRLLPLAVLLANFGAESHLTLAVPTAGVLLVGIAGLIASRPVRRGEPVWRWVIAAVLVGLLCWSAPLIEQSTGSPGNLSLLAEAATTSQPTLGSSAGWHAVVHTAGIPPWWLQGPRNPLQRIGDLSAPAASGSAVSAAFVLAGLAVVALLGLQRRRGDVFAAGALGLALCLGVGLDAASTPQAELTTVDYTLRWAAPAGMCAWLFLGWSLLRLAPPARLRLPQRALAAAVLVVAAAAAGVAVAIDADRVSRPYDVMRAIGERLEREVPGSGTTRVDGTSFDALAFKAGAVYRLRRAGKDVVATGGEGVLGSDYDPRRGFQRVMRIDADEPAALPPPAGRRMVRLSYPAADGSDRVVAVTLSASR
jgi:hypothetical protein